MNLLHPYFNNYPFAGFVHRGGNEEKTENTLEAFQHASDLGFIFMETDVQATNDDEIVVFHDNTLNRLAGVDKKISDLSSYEIRNIDLINGGRIPSLNELLSSFPNLRFNIDIKTNDAVEKSIDIINQHTAFNRVCLAAFSSTRLKKIRKICGDKLCSSMGMSEVLNLVLKSYGFPLNTNQGNCAQVPISYFGLPVVNKQFINTAHSTNKLVHVWTIDEESEINNLIDLGVDGVMTDKPSILMKVLKKRSLI